MKAKHKALLLEMINISDNKEIDTNYLDKAMDKMGGFSESISQINTILRWLNTPLAIIHDYDLKRLSIYEEGLDNDYFIGKMKELFQYCPELEEVFILEEKHIIFNKNLSEAEIQEMRVFVEENLEKKVGSIYIRKKD